MIRGIRYLTALVCLVATASAGDFLRVDEDAGSARLQTAVTRYEKDGASVELVGAIHIADKAYYDKLSERFATYDELLFEMIGGEKLGAAAAAAAVVEPVPEAADAPKKKDLSGLHRIYGAIARFLVLTGQVENIDYRTKNFIHADLTTDEFLNLQAEKGESILGFALAAAMAQPDPKNPPDPAKLLMALISGNADAVKLQIVRTLGEGDDQVAALAGDSVIVTDRNARCMEVLARELAAGHTNLGIFYGAAHFPDMEKRLLDMGFRRTRKEWMTAWDIPKPAAKPAAKPRNAGESDKKKAA